MAKSPIKVLPWFKAECPFLPTSATEESGQSQEGEPCNGLGSSRPEPGRLMVCIHILCLPGPYGVYGVVAEGHGDRSHPPPTFLLGGCWPTKPESASC